MQPTLSIRNTSQLKRQYFHWMQATKRLALIENHASVFAWNGVDRKLKEIIHKSLIASVDNVSGYGKNMNQLFNSDTEFPRLKRSVFNLRELYMRAENTVHFFADALNSRTNESIASLLRACDILCMKSMDAILPALGKESPMVLTYIEKGLGASILKANLRLWDGNIIPVAAIKITQHNLFRPTAIIHETGHQVAHMLGWNEELAAEFRKSISPTNRMAAEAFASWSSEIAADAFSFAHCGYASVSALHNVVSGTPESVFAHHVGDPHPISYVRVLMNIEMCRQFYGKGHWDELEENFKEDYAIETSALNSAPLIKMCVALIPEVVRLLFRKSYSAFNEKTLTDLINPKFVSPTALLKMYEDTGDALFNSPVWINKECIRLMALNGYRIATLTENIDKEYQIQESWMKKLGNQTQLN